MVKKLQKRPYRPNATVDGVRLKVHFLKHVEHYMLLEQGNRKTAYVAYIDILPNKRLLHRGQVLPVPPLRFWGEQSDVLQEQALCFRQ